MPRDHSSLHTIQLLQADTWWSRARGLLFAQALKQNQALWLKPCRGVHTFGMRYAISVYFLDRQGKVVRLIPLLKPFRFVFCSKAYSVIEMLSVPEHMTAELVRKLEIQFKQVETTEP